MQCTLTLPMQAVTGHTTCASILHEHSDRDRHNGVKMLLPKVRHSKCGPQATQKTCCEQLQALLCMISQQQQLLTLSASKAPAMA